MSDLARNLAFLVAIRCVLTHTGRGSCRHNCQLRGLRLVGVQQFGKQTVQFTPFSDIETHEKLGMDGVAVPLKVLKTILSGGCQCDKVASPVRRVGLSIDVAPELQTSGDCVDIVAVQAKTPTDLGLAQRPVLLQRSKNGKIGTSTQRKMAGEQPRTQGGNLACLPADQLAQPVRRLEHIIGVDHEHELNR